MRYVRKLGLCLAIGSEQLVSKAEGTILPSFCSSYLEVGNDLTKDMEDDLKWTANSMYAASADTVRLLILISHE